MPLHEFFLHWFPVGDDLYEDGIVADHEGHQLRVSMNTDYPGDMTALLHELAVYTAGTIDTMNTLVRDIRPNIPAILLQDPELVLEEIHRHLQPAPGAVSNIGQVLTHALRLFPRPRANAPFLRDAMQALTHLSHELLLAMKNLSDLGLELATRAMEAEEERMLAPPSPTR